MTSSRPAMPLTRYSRAVAAGSGPGARKRSCHKHAKARIGASHAPSSLTPPFPAGMKIGLIGFEIDSGT